MVDRAAQLAEVGGARIGARLDQRAAGEIDAEIHADRQKHHDRDDRHDGRERIAHAPEAHETELGIFRSEA